MNAAMPLVTFLIQRWLVWVLTGAVLLLGSSPSWGAEDFLEDLGVPGDEILDVAIDETTGIHYILTSKSPQLILRGSDGGDADADGNPYPSISTFDRPAVSIAAHGNRLVVGYGWGNGKRLELFERTSSEVGSLGVYDPSTLGGVRDVTIDPQGWGTGGQPSIFVGSVDYHSAEHNLIHLRSFDFNLGLVETSSWDASQSNAVVSGDLELTVAAGLGNVYVATVAPGWTKEFFRQQVSYPFAHIPIESGGTSPLVSLDDARSRVGTEDSAVGLTDFSPLPINYSDFAPSGYTLQGDVEFPLRADDPNHHALDNFFVRIGGFFTIDEPGQYSFLTWSDDGVRVRIDGESTAVIEHQGGGPISQSGQRELSQGVHSIEVDYYERGGQAGVEVYIQKGDFDAWADGGWDLIRPSPMNVRPRALGFIQPFDTALPFNVEGAFIGFDGEGGADVPYIARFSQNGLSLGALRVMDGGGATVRDMRIGGQGFLYVLQSGEFSSPGAFPVTVKKLNPTELTVGEERAVVSKTQTGDLALEGVSLTPIDGGMLVSIRSGNGTLEASDTSGQAAQPDFGSLGGDMLVVGRLNGDDLGWQRIKTFPQAPGIGVPPAVAEYNPTVGQVSYFGGGVTGGELVLNPGQSPVTKVPSGHGFFTQLDDQLSLVQELRLTVEAKRQERRPGLPLGDVPLNLESTQSDVRPFFGEARGIENRRYTVEMPEHVYARADRTLVAQSGLSDVELEAAIQNEAVTRYTPVGFTVTRGVDEQSVTGTGRSVSVVLTDDTTVTFTFTTEHALTVRSVLAGETSAPGGDLNAGMPEPAVGKHWVEENELFSTFVNGTYQRADELGSRYVVRGYVAGGAAGSGDDVVVEGVPQRLKVPQFTMTGPGSVTYSWKRQHSITVGTSSTASVALPVTVLDGEVVESNGSGQFWFDEGSDVFVGAKDGEGTEGKALSKVLSASGVLAGLNGLTKAQLAEEPQSTEATGRLIENLVGSGSIVWDYGDKIYRQAVAIGAAVNVRTVDDDLALYPKLTEEVIRTIDERKQPKVLSMLEGPAGSTPETMAVWEENRGMLFPVRPGRFLVEWETDLGDGKVVLTEVTCGFGGDTILNDGVPILTEEDEEEDKVVARFPGAGRDYRGLIHEAIPAVALDPDAEDRYAFLSLQYSSQVVTDEVDPDEIGAPAFVPQVDDGRLVISASGGGLDAASGKHVLVLTRSAAGVVAVGDPAKEEVLVRVLETRAWNSGTGWGDGATAMLADGGEAVIGSKLADATYDTAGLGTGFVVNRKARYNGGIYDRSRVAEAGPIIPVNRHYIPDQADGSNPNDLVVIWYERGAENIVFPYQSVGYEAVWPTTVGRIVIASRLGSEGRAAGGERVLQDELDPLRYSDVSIYAQDDLELTGYNPNEEHAVVAPSLRFSRSANRPTAAYALRAGGLNVTAENASYTSDPYVLVQFFDEETEEVGMRVFAIEETDIDVPARTVSIASFFFPEGGILFGSANHGLLDGESVAVRFDDPDVAFPGLVNGGTYYVLRADDHGFRLAAVEGGAPVVGVEETTGLTLIRNHPYTFDYRALAGKPVLPPWPLPVVIGLTRCDETYGRNGLVGDGSTEARAYWEDFKGIPWAVSDGAFRGYFYYPNREEFWFPEGEERLCVEFLPETSGVTGQVEPKEVKFASEWPADLPVLKVGETLTFAGGEFKADNPTAPGLPGVVGWAAGKVVFDSLNATMSNQDAFDQYAGRLIAPLETRAVGLELSPAEIELIGPATKITEVDGLVWRFAGLPASLKKRVAFDPVGRTLGIAGFLNDKTLGDSTLTQTPPPLYVLEPNLLTGSELTKLKDFEANASGDSLTAILGAKWGTAADALYAAGRNPDELAKGAEAGPEKSNYYAGLEYDTQKDPRGNPYRIDRNGELPAGAFAGDLPEGFDAKLHANELVPKRRTARPMSALGPGLALVPGPGLLAPNGNDGDSTVYLTLAENDDPDIGGPVTLHIVRIVKKHRYRGAIKTVLSDNVFSERTTLRHSGDFGGNLDDLRFEWFYREDDGADVTFDGNVFNVRALKNLVPKWQLLSGEDGFSVDVDGRPDLILPDLRFVARYRHKDDVTDPDAAWTGTEWREFGDPDPGNGELKGELWAGAANSPTVDGRYRPQLVPGWIKRVLDRVNPYEVRFSDFKNNGLPATYVSMIQEFGQGHVGAVALNPDKNVIENVGLIELYQTILDRGRSLSIDQQPPVGTPGIYNALQLASTRISVFYMLLGNEAYADAQDPTVGFGSNSAEFGNAAASIWPFMNQTASPLEEELALLRGVSDSYGRPVHNRLFWNYTKDVGEVAYSLTYNISDENLDGFIDENDARLRYPQGHGDAWGHYSTALRSQYELLNHGEFQWQPRSEFYNLLDVVIPVDYYDERKFARAAAARAKTGSEIVEQTYRSRYVEDPDGQWQGYTDTDTDRAWGVQGWARRAGQGALFDWVTANALIPEIDRRHVDFDDENDNAVWDYGEPVRFSDRDGDDEWDEGEPVFTAAGDSALQRVDRSTVSALGTIPGAYAKIESVYANANAGRNPLGLADGSVTFDIDPAAYIGANGIPGVSHFEQIYERAVQATENAMVLFDEASEHQANLRRQQNGADDLFEDAYEQDRDYRNRLIEIFGEPYSGVIGTGKPYPAGYSGPDLFFHMYVDVADVDSGTVPAPGDENNTFKMFWNGFSQQVVGFGLDPRGQNRGEEGPPDSDPDVPPTAETRAEFVDVFNHFFINDVIGSTEEARAANYGGTIDVDLTDNGILELNLPITASGYAFQTPEDGSWGRRGSTGELQSLLSDLVQAQADLGLSLGDYDALIGSMIDQSHLIQAQHGAALETIGILDADRQKQNTLNKVIATLETLASGALVARETLDRISDITADSVPEILIAGFSNGGDFARPAKTPLKLAGALAETGLQVLSFGYETAARSVGTEIEGLLLQTEILLQERELQLDIKERLVELEATFRDEATTRLEVFMKLEALRQLSDAYQTKLSEGLALLDERQDFNRFSAGAVQDMRYQDMAFRIFRNDQLASYRAAYDLAAQYVFRAAKAYDYETNLDRDDPGYVGGVLEDVVRARTIGVLEDGEPVLGSGGLADALAKLRDNWGVMGTQLGYNNAQAEDSKISLRHELFRISKDGASDGAWRNKLIEFRKDDLWEVPEFRRYCRPFAAKSEGAQPGLVIPMPTEVIAGKNVFGMPLGAADHAFDPSVFATKVVAAGVWFSEYDTSELAVAPRVYLVPAGMDVMSVPTSADLAVRQWNVVDERIPAPHLLSGDSSLELPDFIPVRDSLSGPLGEIRRFSSFRAYGGTGGAVNEDEMSFDSRLIGRSVWNTRWLLIIPSAHLHGEGGIDKFIGTGADPGIGDIHVYFKTFGFSGN